MTTPDTSWPELIYIIRHGEKPAHPPAAVAGQAPSAPDPPLGIDVDGEANPHSLLPRGWQRSGALAALFAPAVGLVPAGLRTPTTLYCPGYGSPAKTQAHRTYQTIEGLSGRIGVPIESPVVEGQEAELIDAVLAGGSTVALICWEHHRIPALASAIPVPLTDARTAVIPSTWPDDRFDVIWSFSRHSATNTYLFSQVPQQLLAGDTDTTIDSPTTTG